jgi:hypothetical protein
LSGLKTGCLILPKRPGGFVTAGACSCSTAGCLEELGGAPGKFNAQGH